MKYLLLILPVLVYLISSTIASLDLFPKELITVWWFDDVMHVVVFGAVAASASHLTAERYGRWWIGTMGVTALAVLDESLQLFFPARAVSLQDLLMSLTGIGLVTLYYIAQPKTDS